jgi:hypothetical protein
MDNTNKISMDNVMEASFGEVSNNITVTFKKTVLIRDYETEVIEATNNVVFEKPLSGIERMFVCAVIEMQMEYTVYVNLMSKGLVTQTEFSNRKQRLEEALYSIKFKADKILGEGVIDKYIEYKGLEKESSDV